MTRQSAGGLESEVMRAISRHEGTNLGGVVERAGDDLVALVVEAQRNDLGFVPGQRGKLLT